MSTYIQEIRQALAVLITDDDIKSLIATTRRKAQHNAAIAAELKCDPGNNGKASFTIKHYYCLYQLWRLIMLGSYDPQLHKMHPHPFISVKTSSHWLRIIFSTLDSHFSGEIAEVAKINTLNFLKLFVYEEEDQQPESENRNISISCAAQILFCCSFSLYSITISTLSGL